MDYKGVMDLILDTDDVTVGGGSASALSGALACGLIGMVCKLSTKKDYGIAPDKQLNYAKELEELREELLKGVVDDANAYGVIRFNFLFLFHVRNRRREGSKKAGHCQGRNSRGKCTP